jgi:hypothetical protein
MKRTNQTLSMVAIIMVILVPIPLLSTMAAEDSLHEGKQPLAAIMGPITATAFVDAVLIEWESLVEFDIIGYHLERGPSATGPWTQLNAGLIQAARMGQVIGDTYEYLDATVESGATYYYCLVIVDRDSTVSYEKPVRAIVPMMGKPYEPYIPPTPSSYHRFFIPVFYR